jgi:hypothetical protein
MKPIALLVLVTIAASALAAAQETGTSPADHAWQTSQHSDPAGTYTFTRFTLAGRFVGSSLANSPAITVDCIPRGASSHAKFLTADLLVGTNLKIDWVEPEEIRGTSYFPKVGVEYRLDGASAGGQQEWQAGTDRVPTGKPSDQASATIPKDALKRILRAHTVSITAEDAQGAPLQMQFDIPDTASLRAACRVDE